ncbi:MAG TPA: M36 family metallopeptidase [Terriglobia bacterium]|nr:M36 family metallopeptidase [Terriglobia bacterium]
MLGFGRSQISPNATKARVLLVIATLAVVSLAYVAPAQQHLPSGRRNPNFDIRTDKASSAEDYRQRVSAARGARAGNRNSEREAGKARLRGRFPSAEIVENRQLGTPEVLSVPPGEEFFTEPSRDRVKAMRAFLSGHADLYGVAEDDVSGLALTADYENPAGNMGWVEFEQRINGIPVFQGRIRGGFTKDGRLARVRGILTSGSTASGAARPSLSAARAVALAAASVDVDAAEEDLKAKATVNGRVTFARGRMARDAKAWPVYFPVSPDVTRLAWATEIWGDPEAYLILIDAEDGTPLFRKNLTSYQSQPATYRIYPSDSPAPLSPTTVLPGDKTQAPYVPRTTVTLIGNEEPYTFNNLGWMTDATNITAGNNVIAGVDVDGVDGVDAPVTGDNRTFDFAFDPQTDMPSAPGYRNGEVTDLFYWVNVFHDRMYALGFTEAAGNFQNDNFGRGGAGGDRISAEAQDSGGVNNANFTAPPDGFPGRLQMYLFGGPDPDRGSSLDHEVVLHELTHGLSSRLHANAEGLTTEIAEGMGEGWSDFYARALLATADEDPNGVFAMGGWSSYLIQPNFKDNYYYGIRRFPYASISTLGSNLKPHNSLTFADTDDTKINFDSAYARSPVAPTATRSPHSLGEIWASALFEVRARFIARLGFEEGNRRILQFVTDAMKLDPASPTMLQGRDSILAAANAGGTVEDIADIWAGFAARGMGLSARELDLETGAVIEAFDRPTTVESAGPTGGTVLTVVVDPVTPSTIYVGKSALGVFKSVDGGLTWVSRSAGMTDLTIKQLAIDPLTPTTIYAGTANGVFKSVDGGDTWVAVNTGMSDLSIVAMAISPSNPSIILVATDARYVYKSVDGASNWVRSDSGIDTSVVRIVSMAFDPSNSSIVYAVGNSIFKSVDGGSNWIKKTPSTGTFVAVDPKTPATVYVSAPSLFYKSLDGFATLPGSVDGGPTGALVIDPGQPSVIYGAKENAGVVKSVDGGLTWISINVGFAGPFAGPQIGAIAIDPSATATLYAGISSGMGVQGRGIYKTLNGGSNWIAINSGLGGAVVNALGIVPATSTLYCGTDGNRIFRSLNQGADWVGLGSTLPMGSVTALAFDPVNSSVLYAGTDASGVFKSIDGGINWASSSGGGSGGGASIQRIDVSRSNPLTLFQAASSKGIYKSSDGGMTWTQVFSAKAIAALAIDPSSDLTVYAGASQSAHGVYKTTDGGANWTLVGLNNTRIIALVIDPLNTATIYAASPEEGVFKSTDSGSTWTAVGSGLRKQVRSLAFDPANSAILYAGTHQGIFKTSNGGTIWREVGPALFARFSVNAVLLDPSNSAIVYAGLSGGGVFKSVDAGEHWQPTGAAITASPPTITSIFPTGGAPGDVFDVTLTGTGFAPIMSIDLGSGVTVSNLTVMNATSAQATVTISIGANGSVRSAAVTTSDGTGSGASFAVEYKTPTLTAITPASGYQGSKVNVTLTGTNFIPNFYISNGGAGITVSNVTVVSTTTVTATFGLGQFGGPITVTTPGGTSGPVRFDIMPAPLTQFSPNIGRLGQINLEVAITGQFTNFTQGASGAKFGQGIMVSSLTVVDPTHAIARIHIAPDATPGPRDVTVTTFGAEARADGAFTVVAVPGRLAAWGRNDVGQATVPSGRFVAAAAGGSHSVAIRADGTLAAWGDNTYGQLNVPSGAFLAVAAGQDFSVALRGDQSLIAWGRNDKGQNTSLSGPFTAISAGANHGLAITSGGNLSSWGDNSFGQRNAPNYPFQAVAAGGRHSLGLLLNGVVVGWGDNSFGQSSTHGGPPVTAIAAGENHSLGLLFNGTLIGWGDNSFGQSTVPSGVFSAIAAAGNTSLAIRTDGTAVIWGENTYGQTNVPAGLLWGIFPGPSHSVAIRNDLVSHDLNGDGMSDILWAHTDGTAAGWLMNGLTAMNGSQLLGPGTGWNIIRLADFNGDGKNDIVWRHTDGSSAVWLMNGLNMADAAFLVGSGTGWSVEHIGDFNGDGKSDLLWRNTDGAAVIWQMDGMGPSGFGVLVGPGTGWSVQHIGDFDGDGKSDLLWRNTDGTAVIWQMDGMGPSGFGVLVGPGTGWSVQYIGDFNGDGKSDLLWRHDDGTAVIWQMNGLSLTNVGVLVGPGTDWSVQQIGDFNGDGKSDLMWRHHDGSVVIWLMDGLSPVGIGSLVGPGTGWNVQQIGDFNGDGKGDILWRHTDGSTVIWKMNGLNSSAAGGLIGAGTGWSPLP